MLIHWLILLSMILIMVSGYLANKAIYPKDIPFFLVGMISGAVFLYLDLVLIGSSSWISFLLVFVCGMAGSNFSFNSDDDVSFNILMSLSSGVLILGGSVIISSFFGVIS